MCRLSSLDYNDAHHEGIFFALFHWDYRSNPDVELSMLHRMILHWRTHDNIVLDCGGTGIYKYQVKISDALWRADVMEEEELCQLGRQCLTGAVRHQMARCD